MYITCLDVEGSTCTGNLGCICRSKWNSGTEKDHKR